MDSVLSAITDALNIEVAHPQNAEHDIISVFFAGKTKRGQGDCTLTHSRCNSFYPAISFIIIIRE